jgi:hypothetical protein
MVRLLRNLILALTLGGVVLAGSPAGPAMAQFGLPGIEIAQGYDPWGEGSQDGSDAATEEGQERDLGTAAVALVEDIKNAPGAGVGIMDYVFPKQEIALGEGGVIVLAHLDSCLVETIKGGTVTVSRAGSKVAGGSLETANVDCQAAKPIITAENREAGAVVNRVTVFDGVDWSEQVIKAQRPTLKWNGAKGESRIRIVDMDRPEPTIIWQGKTTGSFIVYPADAAQLRIGMPYRVEVSEPDGKTFAALFSIDPDLEVPDTLLSRVVTVNR